MKKLLAMIVAVTMLLGLFAAAHADFPWENRTPRIILPSLPGGSQEATEPAEEPAAEQESAAEPEPAAEPAAEEPAAEEPPSEGLVGYIMYANSDWSAQYWGTDDGSAVAAAAGNATVTGSGDYTASLDFTSLEGGSSKGLAFMALGITDGETAYPGWFLKINEIRVNGEPIEFTKGYTSSDDGVTTRMNIYNEWVSALPADARSCDGKTDDASWIIVDKEAFADVASVEVDFTYADHATDLAYIMYANADWSAQYWGADDGSGVAAKNAVIDGYGDYTVGLDFTALEGGAASGLAFAAVGIVNGENTYPGAMIRINGIRVNGEPVEFAKGYTSSDDGVTTRMNVYNEWVSALPEDARSYDGVTDDASWIIVDKEAFASVGTVEIDFTLLPRTDVAYLMYADGSWTNQYWGGEPAEGITAVNATVDGAGTYTVSLDFTGTEAGSAAELAFAAVGVTTGEQTFPGYFIDVKEVKVNGEAIELGKGYTSSDDGICTRENLYNEWVSELPADARRADGDLTDASPVIVAKEAFADVKTVEVTFDYIYGAAPAKDSGDAPYTEEEAAELLAADYHAYIGVQCKDNYTFRNAWNDSYGRDDAEHEGYFDRLTGWEGQDAVDYGGTFEDALMTGEGTYTVSLTTGDMGFGATEAFNLLFVSTEVPSKLVEEGHVTFSDVKVKIGDASTKEYTEIDTSGEYAMIKLIDTYNQAAEPFGYTMPGANTTITITFTVSGLTD